jgi:hypothetical protein
MPLSKHREPHHEVDANPAARLVYLVGPGRGGSTLFERVLNSSAKAFALGEFHCLWRLDTARIVCACGQAFNDCGFWRAVMAQSGLGSDGLASLRLLERQVVRSLFIVRQGLSLKAIRRDPRVHEYLALQQRVFDAVSAETGASYLIDSSKAGPRAWLVATQARNLVVQLHRDAVEVLTSWRQPKWDPPLNAPMHKPSVAAAAIDWWKAEAWAAALAARRTVVRIDYAGLVAQPRPVLEQALAAQAAGLVASVQWLDDRSVTPSAEYHSLNGNPDRFNAGPIMIASRPPGLERLPVSDRVAIRLMGGLLDRLAP